MTKIIKTLILFAVFLFANAAMAQEWTVGNMQLTQNDNQIIKVAVSDVMVSGMANQKIHFGFMLSSGGNWVDGSWRGLEPQDLVYDPSYWNGEVFWVTYEKDYIKQLDQNDLWCSFFIVKTDDKSTIGRKDFQIILKEEPKEESAGKATAQITGKQKEDNVEVFGNFAYQGTGRTVTALLSVNGKDGQLITDDNQSFEFNQGGYKSGNLKWVYAKDKFSAGEYEAVVVIKCYNQEVGRATTKFNVEEEKEDEEEELKAPKNVYATNKLTDRIEISWEAAEGADFYNVYRQLNDGYQREWAQIKHGVTQTFYSDTWNVVIGAKYNYKVCSGKKNPAKESEASNIAEGSLTTSNAPNLISVTAKPGSLGGFILEWAPLNATKDDWVEVWISQSANGEFKKCSWATGYTYANVTSARTIGYGAGYSIQFDTPYYFKIRVMKNNGAQQTEFSNALQGVWPRN